MSDGRDTTIEFSYRGCLVTMVLWFLFVFLAYHGGELADIVLGWLRA